MLLIGSGTYGRLGLGYGRLGKPDAAKQVLAEMKRHVKSSRQPLFAFVETMATHGPYDFALMPEVDVPGGGPGTDPEMHEYLRRLAMARMDYGFLRAELYRLFPDQQFLIIHYGDHQPMATWTLLGLSNDSVKLAPIHAGAYRGRELA